jgi:hypothetical protein
MSTYSQKSVSINHVSQTATPRKSKVNMLTLESTHHSSDYLPRMV